MLTVVLGIVSGGGLHTEHVKKGLTLRLAQSTTAEGFTKKVHV